MKKLIMTLSGLMLISAFIFTSCQQNQKPAYTETKVDVYTIDAATTTAQEGHSWNIASISLQDFANKTINITFSADMKVTNTGDSANLVWKITATKDGKDVYPTIASQTFAKGTSEWTTVTGSGEGILLNNNPVLYIDTNGVTPVNLTIQVKNIAAKVTVVGETDETTLTEIKVETGVTKESLAEDKSETPTNWLSSSVPSLKETYADIFDSMGLACEYSSWAGVNELSVKSVRDGLAKHVDSITMGNEFKPDSFFGYQWSGAGKTMVDFAASNGKTIKVPKDLQFTTADKCLAACKEAGLKMRGHVLVWHAQTPDNFFAENYVANIQDNLITNKVSPEVMNARMEWYIKTILEHVAEWESINNDGEHIIWAWDVINETVADDANESNWVRGSTNDTKNRPPASAGDGACGSRWYQVYGDSSFVIDAFRFANAYAPADVKLCYNDYNEYMPNKTEGIIKLIQAVKAGSKKTINGKPVAPRIDVMGLQSHVGTQWPGVSSYEEALKKYLKLVDCHVTEFDVSATTANESANSYAEYFKMLKQYGKKYSGSHRITNVTIWGINNKSSWIYKDNVKYPLLFDNFETTKTFWAVINAAK